jgi:hypothetical protein
MALLDTPPTQVSASLAEVQVVSAPDALVTEKVYRLSRSAAEQMRIRVVLPSAVPAAQPEAAPPSTEPLK